MMNLTPWPRPPWPCWPGKAILPEDPLTKEAALVLLGGLDQQGVWISTSGAG